MKLIKDQLTSLTLLHKNPKTWTKIVLGDTDIMRVITPVMQRFNISVPAAVYCIVNDTSPMCPNGTLRPFTWFAKGFAYCGTRDICKCNSVDSTLKARNTNLIRYGTESYAMTSEYQEKTKITNMDKFGVEQASFSTEVRDRAKKTCLDKYGTEYPMQLLEFKTKVKDTKKQRYGDENYSNINKRNQTLQEKYGVTNPTYIAMSDLQIQTLFNEEKFKEFITNKTIQFASTSLGVDPNTINKYSQIYNCQDLLDISNNSKWEQIIAEYLDSLGIRYIQNTKKVIPPCELDFFLPDFNVAIELNGNYWHSESMGKDKDYHFNKWQTCRNLNIDLYQFFEDELIGSLDIIKAKISYLTHSIHKTIGARKTQISTIKYAAESKFLDFYHIQGACKARDGSFGAFYNTNLVGVICWRKRPSYLEITRFATDNQACYPGLFSKLLTHTISYLGFTGKIISFSNNSHSNGNLYKSTNFVQQEVLKAAYWYTKDYSIRENRQKYMKSKIEKKFNIDVSKKTEKSLMKELGYDRIWDSGKIKCS